MSTDQLQEELRTKSRAERTFHGMQTQSRPAKRRITSLNCKLIEFHRILIPQMTVDNVLSTTPLCIVNSQRDLPRIPSNTNKYLPKAFYPPNLVYLFQDTSKH